MALNSEEILAALDDEQRAVALASRGPVCVIAGAGTGKTRAITHRIAYAASIGVKRSAFSLWEAGTHRMSLDGALALRSKYGLSLDFMYEGIDDALPMTLRAAWRGRP